MTGNDTCAKLFSPGAILTVTHGRMLCELDELYDILKHLTGEAPFTHQILRFSKECTPYLQKTFPEIMNVYCEVHGKEDALSLVRELNEKFGNVLVDETPGDIKHDSMDAICELMVR